MRAAVVFVALCSIFLGTLLVLHGVTSAPPSVYPNTQHVSTIPNPIPEKR